MIEVKGENIAVVVEQGGIPVFQVINPDVSALFFCDVGGGDAEMDAEQVQQFLDKHGRVQLVFPTIGTVADVTIQLQLLIKGMDEAAKQQKGAIPPTDISVVPKKLNSTGLKLLGD